MKYLFALILCLGIGAAHGQNRDQNWYFGGNAALRFNAPPAAPTVLTGSQLFSYEATASISDLTGRLQFYTNAVYVWDRNNSPMPNGTLTGGFQSASQGALIVPDPGNSGKYYVFVVDAAENGFTAGLHYSVVDMTLRNGLGDVVTTSKNIKVTTPTPWLTEKLTAVQHANGRDYWIVVHGWQNSNFYAFLLSDTGLATTAVSSTIGIIHSGGGGGVANGVGYMRASPNGRLFAVAIRDAAVELFDFNNGTGQLSNLRRLYTTSTDRVYGVAFSPDNTKLYTTDLAFGVYQFDLSASTSTRQFVGTTAGQSGAVATAPDGRIYVASHNTNHLAAITNPNGAAAACGFVSQYVTLSGTSQIGLPNFSNLFSVPSISFAASAPCLPGPTTFTATAANLPNVTFTWNFGDPASGAANTATGPSATHTFSGPGTYQVILNGLTPTGTLATSQQIAFNTTPSFSLGPDTVFCPGQPVLLRPLPDQPAGSSYRWQDGSTRASFTARAPGTYWLEVTRNGCRSRAEVVVRSNCSVLIPNIITPDNGDELNQSFVLKGLNPTDWSLTVFNRWGTQVFSSRSYDNGWRAEGQPAGVYYYMLRHASNGQNYQGWVEVVRP